MSTRPRSPRRAPFWLPLLLMIPLAGLSCHDDDNDNNKNPDPDPIPAQPGPPASIHVVVATQNQTAQVNQNVAASPSVQVVDAGGRSVPGVGVTFAVQSGGGSVTGASQTTDAAGSATVGSWRMGPAPGANTLLVQVGGLTATINATGTAPPQGSLAIAVAGLPAGVPALITVTGANGYAADVSGPITLTALPAGAYTVAAAPVQQPSATYTPSPASQTATVTAGGTTQAAVTYAPASAVNLVLDGALFFQTVQSAQGTIPMIADKPAVLRVWAHATRANTHRVPVRLRIFHGSQLLHDTMAFGPNAVPTTYSAGDPAASWNIRVRGDLIQPGISASIQLDPQNAVAESSEADNAFPSSGSAAVAVQTMPGFRIRFLRVCMAYPPFACGQLGDPDDMMRTLYTVFPVWRREIIPAYQWNTTRDITSNPGWDGLLQDMAALRIADGYGGTGVHYMGIVNAPQGTWEGYAQIGGFAGLAKFNDPVGGRITIAHELGHNFGRRHAPCGGPADPDPAYPTPDASVGTYGVDLYTGQVTTPLYKDIMSYCPPHMTASEYTYRSVMQARLGPFPEISGSASGPRPIVVVAGRLAGGVLTLDPAFDATAPAALPSGRGRFLLEGLDEAGRTLFSYRFEPTEAGHRAGKAQIFAFGIPMAPDARARLHELRISDGVRRVSRRSPRGPSLSRTGKDGSVSEQVVITPEGNGVRVRWDAARYEAIWLREARSGRLIAMLNGGSGRVVTGETEFDVQLSDGVQTVRARVRRR